MKSASAEAGWDPYQVWYTRIRLPPVHASVTSTVARPILERPVQPLTAAEKSYKRLRTVFEILWPGPLVVATCLIFACSIAFLGYKYSQQTRRTEIPSAAASSRQFAGSGRFAELRAAISTHDAKKTSRADEGHSG